MFMIDIVGEEGGENSYWMLALKMGEGGMVEMFMGGNMGAVEVTLHLTPPPASHSSLGA